eukprot:8730593-Pyramimonas_sp.AAC.1
MLAACWAVWKSCRAFWGVLGSIRGPFGLCRGPLGILVARLGAGLFFETSRDKRRGSRHKLQRFQQVHLSRRCQQVSKYYKPRARWRIA